MKQMRTTLIVLAFAVAAGPAVANDVFGIWQTEKNNEGKYLEVEVHACEADPAKVCGTIVAAKGGAEQSVVGKPMIWDMAVDAANEWDDGKIWKPDDDEVYSSQMQLEGNTLTVSGCVLGGLICRSQAWPRVK
ncbi:MAG: DUF2147 domain-containing protein [Paracoccaceae bacterium]